MRALLVLTVLALASCGGGDNAQTQESAGELAEALPSRTVEIQSQVYPTPEAAEPLPVGAQVPAVNVHRLSGEAVNLAAEVNQGATLIFYRGGW